MKTSGKQKIKYFATYLQFNNPNSMPYVSIYLPHGLRLNSESFNTTLYFIDHPSPTQSDLDFSNLSGWREIRHLLLLGWWQLMKCHTSPASIGLENSCSYNHLHSCLVPLNFYPRPVNVKCKRFHMFPYFVFCLLVCFYFFKHVSLVYGFWHVRSKQIDWFIFFLCHISFHNCEHYEPSHFKFKIVI